jgi:uncharacterized membrane protein YGL010W
MLAGRPWSDWIARYSESHRHPVNRVCHTIGIPLIAASLPLFVLAWFVRGPVCAPRCSGALAQLRFWHIPLAMFVVGWAFQFVGHAFEGKPPEFVHDWRFLFVGLRWWFAKVRGTEPGDQS